MASTFDDPPQQCSIQFRLVQILYINDTSLLNPNAQDRERLRNFLQNTGGFELYYVDRFPDAGYTGENSAAGSVVNDDGNGRTAAHELGHAFGLPHRGTADVSLMHDTFSDRKADVTLGECNSLTNFSHN